ncbi:hypothetical protein [Promicromonospora sp. NPDC023805]|uniref:hypothetical protein n=1 Tax=Promicromonospora sp. NPDC023805 TaxID=3154696 RepID=UPI0033E94409
MLILELTFTAAPERLAARPELDRILDADPYYRTPGVEVTRIREWVPVVGAMR